MNEKTEKLIAFFEEVNKQFLDENWILIEINASERCLCGALMVALHDCLKNSEYSGYSVDVEYNRVYGDEITATIKTINGPERDIIPIFCDLIVHNRGNKGYYDNLIALEMKKSDATKQEKDLDRHRLEYLTTDPSKYDIWGDGVSSEQIFGYQLGIFYVIDVKSGVVTVEYIKGKQQLGTCRYEITRE